MCRRRPERGPRVVGFTSTFSQTVPSLALAKMLKLADPALTVVFGGANCDGPMGPALMRTSSWIDVVVRGEAESIVVDVMRDLLAGRTPGSSPGVCYREGGGAGGRESDGERDRHGRPSHSEVRRVLRTTRQGLALPRKVLAEVRVPYESARGCWWGAKSHCTFCGPQRLQHGLPEQEPSPRPRRAGDPRATLRATRPSGRRHIIDVRYLRDVLPSLRDRGYDLSLFYETKANLRKDQGTASP